MACTSYACKEQYPACTQGPELHICDFHSDAAKLLKWTKAAGEGKSFVCPRPGRCCTEHNRAVTIHTVLLCSCDSSHTAGKGCWVWWCCQADGNKFVCCTFNAQPRPLPEQLACKCSNNLLNAELKSHARTEIVQHDTAKGGPWGKRAPLIITHKTNNLCCCWAALCSNSSSFSLQINLPCYKYEKYSNSNVEE